MPEEFRQFGKMLADAILLIYIYFGVIAVVLISAIVLVISYIKKIKSSENTDRKKITVSANKHYCYCCNINPACLSDINFDIHIIKCSLFMA